MDTKVLTAYLMERLGEIKGKKAFQKLVYLAQALEIPLGKAYCMHYYGPYSEEVAEEMNELINKGLIINRPDTYSYITTADTTELLEKSEDVAKYSEQLDDLIAKFGHMTPRELEIYATAHFIDFKFNNLDGISDKDKIIEEIKKAKSPKFSDEEILKAYNDLEEWDLLH